MNSINLIVFLLAGYGITNIITGGKIFNFLQKQHTFFKCAMCVGFWVGCVLALSGLFNTLPPVHPLYKVMNPVSHYIAICANAFFGGTVCSGFCWFMRVLLHKLGEDEL